MKYTEHQKGILRERFDRETLQEGYRDRSIDRTTDAERTHVVLGLPKVTYDERYNRMLSDNLNLNV